MVLLLAPWMVVWERNYFVDRLPFWENAVRLDEVRGAVSGVGLVSLGLGVWELRAVFGAVVRRRRGREPGPLPPPAAGVERALAEETGSWSRKR